MKIVYYFFLLFILFFTACSDDDPEVITEIVTVRDTITITQHDTSVVIQHDTTIIIIHDTTVLVQIDTIIDLIGEDSSVVAICVRHAETTGAGGNPPLSAAGQQRASDLSHALSNIELDHVYSTNFLRTRETAMTTAMDQGLPVELYSAFDIAVLAEDIKREHRSQEVLVVGHSNTTPQLLNQLTQTNDFIIFNENTYDNLFIVNVKVNGETVVYHLEYGVDTP